MRQWLLPTNNRFRFQVEDLDVIHPVVEVIVPEQDLIRVAGTKVPIPAKVSNSEMSPSVNSNSLAAVYPGLSMPANQLSLAGFPDLPDPYLVRVPKRERNDDGW